MNINDKLRIVVLHKPMLDKHFFLNGMSVLSRIQSTLNMQICVAPVLLMLLILTIQLITNHLCSNVLQNYIGFEFVESIIVPQIIWPL